MTTVRGSLTSVDSLGNATFAAEHEVLRSSEGSGRVREGDCLHVTTQAEENQLQAGAIDLGYVDPSILTSPAPKPGVAGPNWGQLASRYNLYRLAVELQLRAVQLQHRRPEGQPPLRSSTSVKPLQDAVDQLGIITNVDKGYGFPIYSPLPPNTPASVSGNVPNPYPVQPDGRQEASDRRTAGQIENGVQTCDDPGTGATSAAPASPRATP